MVYNKEIFGRKIKNYRKKLGVSARKMSIELGFNYSYIATIECGRVYPSFSHFFEILDYFHISPQEFFAEETIEEQ